MIQAIRSARDRHGKERPSGHLPVADGWSSTDARHCATSKSARESQGLQARERLTDASMDSRTKGKRSRGARSQCGVNEADDHFACGGVGPQDPPQGWLVEKGSVYA